MICLIKLNCDFWLHFYSVCYCRCEFPFYQNVCEQRVLIASSALFLHGRSLPFTLLHPPLHTNTLFPFSPFLPSSFLDPPSRFLSSFPFLHITIHLCIFPSCSAPTQSEYISALTHSLSLLSIQTSHFYFPLHLVPLSSQSSTSSLTLIPTGPGEWDVNISFEHTQARTHAHRCSVPKVFFLWNWNISVYYINNKCTALIKSSQTIFIIFILYSPIWQICCNRLNLFVILYNKFTVLLLSLIGFNHNK